MRVDATTRALHHPPLVRVRGLAHGVSPRLADRLLRTLRGPTAAPRSD